MQGNRLHCSLTQQTGESTMSTNSRNELYELMHQARIERARVEKIEGIVGGVIFSTLGACVIFTMIYWIAR